MRWPRSARSQQSKPQRPAVARPRRKALTVDSRLSDPDPAAWLAPADYKAVEAAGLDCDLLAAIVKPDHRKSGSLRLRLGAGRPPLAEQPQYILRLLAHDRRSAAIRSWANDNALDPKTAMTYFLGQGRPA